MVLYASSLPAWAEDREWIPYKKLMETVYADKFYATPVNQRDKVKLQLKLRPKNPAVSPTSVILTLVHENGRQRIPIAADGEMDLPFNPAWMNDNTKILTSLSKEEKAGPTAVFASRMPEGLQWNYVALMASVRQWNDLVKTNAGVLRFLAPKFTGIELQFSKPSQQTLTVMSKEGARVFAADAKGQLKIRLDDALMKDNPQIVLSERPAEMGVSDE